MKKTLAALFVLMALAAPVSAKFSVNIQSRFNSIRWRMVILTFLLFFCLYKFD